MSAPHNQDNTDDNDESVRLFAEPAPWGFGAPLIASLAGLVAGSVGFQLVASAQDLPPDTQSVASMAGGVIALWIGLGAVLYAALSIHRGGFWHVVGVRDRTESPYLAARPRWLALSAVLGVVVQLVVVPLLYLPVKAFDADVLDRIDDNARQVTDLIDTPLKMLVMAVILVVGAPLAEEILYRGALTSGLRNRLGVVVSIAVSSIVFGAIHFQPLQFPALALFGGLLGYLAHRAGSIWPAVVCHATFNATTLVALTLA
jgi:membrane protease YdiL (CAAX protease family)